jgi:hypothetical protein
MKKNFEEKLFSKAGIRVLEKCNTVNGTVTLKYSLDGVVWLDGYCDIICYLRHYMREKYYSLGNFYKTVFDVPAEIAKLAGWKPDDSDFSVQNRGFAKFCADGGIIKQQEETVKEKVISYKELNN